MWCKSVKSIEGCFYEEKKRFDLNGLYYLCRFVVVIFVSIAQRQTTCHIEYKARQPSRLSKCHSVTIHIAKTEKNAADFKFPTFFIHFHIFTTSFHSWMRSGRAMRWLICQLMQLLYWNMHLYSCICEVFNKWLLASCTVTEAFSKPLEILYLTPFLNHMTQ